MKLVSIRLENIGGFSTTEFPICARTVLVGENNSGKTSILRVLAWCMQNADDLLLRQGRTLERWEQSLLTPARPTRNSARRIFLRVRIDDGRVARRFCGPGKRDAALRIQFRKGGAYAKLTAPEKGEPVRSEDKALELLARLQDDSAVVYVPAARDSSTQIYQDSLRRLLHSTLRAGLLQSTGRKAGPALKLHAFANSITLDGTNHATRAWDAIKSWTDGLFDPDTSFELAITPETTVDWLTDQVIPKFSFSDVDKDRVTVECLGAGPQSILAMALIVHSLDERPNRYLLLEEPESFLHPTAQRTLANRLFQHADHDLLVTTHSPEVVAESCPSDVRILVNHVVYAPKAADALQETKDQYLLSNSAARSLFARSVLLVEGPGEEAFFEALRRRLAGHLPPEVLGAMQVVGVGGKAAFGPWLRLLRRYGDHQGNPAIKVLFAVDSADGVSDAKRALTESAVPIPSQVKPALSAVAGTQISAYSTRNEYAAELRSKTAAANADLEGADLPLRLVPVDLEYAMLAGLPDARAAEVASIIGHTADSLGLLLSSLGSKGGSNQPSDKAQVKAPYKRAIIGNELLWDEIPPEAKELLWAWARNASASPLRKPGVLGLPPRKRAMP